MLKQSKIIAKPSSLRSLPSPPQSSQSLLHQLESGVFFQELHNYDFDVPNDNECHSYVIALFSACLIHLDYKREESLISCLYNKDVEQNANEFLLLADTYYQKKSYFNAKRFYHLLLTQVKEFLVQLDIWLKYGNCCNYLEEVEEAINAYRNAVNLDDSNCEAALSLVNILKKNSQMFEEATNVIRNTLSHHTHENKKLNTEVNLFKEK
jgi:tetratricopeptide (TPR) repeat protein